MAQAGVSVSKETYVKFSGKRDDWQGYKARIKIIAAEKGWDGSLQAYNKNKAAQVQSKKAVKK